MLALNMHKESSYTSLPFYLAECRKRIFAATYQQDKMTSLLTDRPPRLIRRYSNCKMPLDLSDADLLVEDPMQPFNIQLGLTQDGWCTSPRYSGSSWARMRFKLATFYEEILENVFEPLTPEYVARMRQV